MNGIKFDILSRAKTGSRLDEIMLICSDVPHENWTQAQYLIDLPGKWEISLAASDGNRILAYIIASEKAPGNAHIHKFIVNPSDRGKGIGECLLSEFISRLDDRFRLITLKVYIDNPGALRFYFKNGFVISDNQSNMYIMRMNLPCKNI